MSKETVFKYSAMDAQGKEKFGEITASDQSDANSKLKNIGLFPTSIKKVGKPESEKNKGLSIDEKINRVKATTTEPQPQSQPKEKNSRTIFQMTIFGFRFSIERV